VFARQRLARRQGVCMSIGKLAPIAGLVISAVARCGEESKPEAAVFGLEALLGSSGLSATYCK
jgi:hypothetical protein